MTLAPARPTWSSLKCRPGAACAKYLYSWLGRTEPTNGVSTAPRRAMLYRTSNRKSCIVEWYAPSSSGFGVGSVKLVGCGKAPVYFDVTHGIPKDTAILSVTP